MDILPLVAADVQQILGSPLGFTFILIKPSLVVQLSWQRQTGQQPLLATTTKQQPCPVSIQYVCGVVQQPPVTLRTPYTYDIYYTIWWPSWLFGITSDIHVYDYIFMCSMFRKGYEYVFNVFFRYYHKIIPFFLYTYM